MKPPDGSRWSRTTWSSSAPVAPGMTAALAAARQGLDTVLVEKSDWFGGSTARSGGGVWIPGNYALRRGR